MMMKKLRILVLFFILTFSFSVRAEVLLEIDCNGKEIAPNKTVTCEGNLLYEKEGINDIEFNYNTNLNIDFSSVNGFMITNRGGRVSIHTNDALYDEIMNSTKIMEFTLSFNEKANEKEKLTISDIMINKGRDIKVGDISKEFTITGLTPKLDSVCTLDSITVEKEKVKDFNKDKLEYRGINVTKDIIFVDAIRTSSKSSATGLGNVRVPNGETVERDITVTAEDGTKKVYKLFVTNINSKGDVDNEPKPDEGEKSSDNTLKSLELYHGKKKVKLNFNPKTEVYNVQVDDDLDAELTIKAVPNDEKATFTEGYGPRSVDISYGYNKEYIKVLAEDGGEKTITLNINYLDNRDKDNSLLSLTINGKEVDLNSDKLEVKLTSDNKKTIIEAIPTSEKSTVKYEDIELALGDNELSIEVTSEDGETEEYDVNVIVEEDKVLLENVSVTGYNLNFMKNKASYDLVIKNDVNKLDIVINPDNVKHEILNNNNLKNGSKVIIKITDSESSYQYTINIQKEGNPIISIICYIVFGVGIILLIASIIYYVKKRK